ncbi:MAG: hypothetical protein Q8R37_00315 [Nanoarchaeota archaeon]|nr:hypothetical protein [Nanoarchaeota archaeon]
MTTYIRKEISELERSLTGKKIEVVGKRVGQIELSYLYQFYAWLFDHKGNKVHMRGSPGFYVWSNQFERVFKKEYLHQQGLIVQGRYQMYGWSYNPTHIINVEKLKIIDCSGNISIVENEWGNISIADVGNISLTEK